MRLTRFPDLNFCEGGEYVRAAEKKEDDLCGIQKGGRRHAGPISVRPTDRDRGPSDAFVRLNANVRVRERGGVGWSSNRVGFFSERVNDLCETTPTRAHLSVLSFSPCLGDSSCDVCKVFKIIYSLSPFYSVKLLQLLFICPIFHLPPPGGAPS